MDFFRTMLLNRVIKLELDFTTIRQNSKQKHCVEQKQILRSADGFFGVEFFKDFPTLQALLHQDLIAKPASIVFNLHLP